jgi:PAS domain S-box-containing protein
MSSPYQRIDKKRPVRVSLHGGSTSRIVGEGEMAGLIRAFHWEDTSLGPVEFWSDTLVTTVNLLLASRHPMFLWWGPELIQFYNDGYRPSIRADKHPNAVGQRGADCWPEIWSIIGPQIESVMNEGRSTWNINQLVPINRDGKLEEVYWTYSYSPVTDHEGAVQGTLVVCSDTTEQVLSNRRLKALLAVTAGDRTETQLSQSTSAIPFAEELVSTLRCDPADVPFAILYQLRESEIVCLGATSAANGPIDALCTKLADLAHAEAPALVEDLGGLVGEKVVCEPWPEPVTRAYVLPLSMHGAPADAALVFGISPRLPFDKSYETFFQLVGTRIAGLLQSETQRLELARAALRFRALVEADPFGMVIGNLAGELSYVNPVFLKTLGYTEDDVISGKVRWDNLTPREYAEADARAVEQLRARGRCNVYEKVYVAKDGRRIPILIGASIIGSLAGEAEVAAFVTELTPLKTAQEALRKANDGLERKVTERTAALEAEVAERKRAEMNLRELSGRLLTAQDAERRHMARELHDNAGQILAALVMNLSALETAATGEPSGVVSLASEARQLSETLSNEIRTLSYLLHPPLLDEVGLESAITWYVGGFSERSKIKVDVHLPAPMERLPREIEMVIFRVVQESLTNVHRHSGSSSARIDLTRTEHHVALEITDFGKGISMEKQRELTSAKAGVGLRGMEERVRQFGGRFKFKSSDDGTKVTVSLPVTTDR